MKKADASKTVLYRFRRLKSETAESKVNDEKSKSRDVQKINHLKHRLSDSANFFFFFQVTFMLGSTHLPGKNTPMFGFILPQVSPN